MKRFLACLLVLMTLCPAAGAEWIPSQEYDEAYFQFTGEIAHEAVVLCQSLTVRAAPSFDAEAVLTLESGEPFLTNQTRDGWLNVLREDGEKGWVRAEYVLEHPSFLRLTETTRAFAFDGEDAPTVGLLDAGTTLPIIRRSPEGYVISLRGAAAWIPRAQEALPNTIDWPVIEQAELRNNAVSGGDAPQRLSISAPQRIAALMAILSDTTPRESAAGCPFGLTLLILTASDGRQLAVDVAADDCCIFRMDGRDYSYAVSRDDRDSGMLLRLFLGGE